MEYTEYTDRRFAPDVECRRRSAQLIGRGGQGPPSVYSVYSVDNPADA